MKAITIYQPWASLIACGAKRFETRSWATNHRGIIAIHAGARSVTPFLRGLIKADDDYALRDFALAYKETGLGMMEDLPRGAVIATAELVECRKIMAVTDGNDDGRFCRRSPIADKMEAGDLLAHFWHENPIIISADEYLFGDWAPGRYAWELVNVKPMSQVPCKGQQGLWNWEGVAT